MASAETDSTADAASPVVVDTPSHVVVDDKAIARALTRIAHEILERNSDAKRLVLLGIPRRGVPLAQRIAAKIAEVESYDVPVGALDTTMYRDDLGRGPVRSLMHTDIPNGGVDDKIVVLVDDVLFSGRTIRAALDALTEIGRPAAIRRSANEGTPVQVSRPRGAMDICTIASSGV